LGEPVLGPVLPRP
jgi:hypothetical protein